jgi:hypothetical protein
MPPIAWTPDKDTLLAAWAAETPPVSITEQAARLGTSRTAIARRRKHLDITSDRTTTAAANEARRVDAAARRTELQHLLLEDAEKLRARLWKPYEYIDHGGKDYLEVRWTQNEPSPTDQLKLMQAAGIAVDRSLKISDHDSDTGTIEAVSMLGDIAKLITDAAATMPAEGP